MKKRILLITLLAVTFIAIGACTKKHPAELAMGEFVQAVCKGDKDAMEKRVDFESLSVNSLNVKGITADSTKEEKEAFFNDPRFLPLKSQFYDLFLKRSQVFCDAKIVSVADVAEKVSVVRIANDPKNPSTFFDATVSQCSKSCRMIAFKFESAS